MKKKAWFFVLAGVLALSLGATAAMAAGRGQAAQGQNYVDANGDGVCDNQGTQAKTWQGGHHQNGGHHRNCR